MEDEKKLPTGYATLEKWKEHLWYSATRQKAIAGTLKAVIPKITLERFDILIQQDRVTFKDKQDPAKTYEYKFEDVQSCEPSDWGKEKKKRTRTR